MCHICSHPEGKDWIVLSTGGRSYTIQVKNSFNPKHIFKLSLDTEMTLEVHFSLVKLQHKKLSLTVTLSQNFLRLMLQNAGVW